MVKPVYEEPHEDAVADKRTYQRLQSEMETRSLAAQTVPLSALITAPTPEPRFVDGRWVP